MLNDILGVSQYVYYVYHEDSLIISGPYICYCQLICINKNKDNCIQVQIVDDHGSFTSSVLSSL